MLSWGFIVGRANQGKTGGGNGNFSVLHFWSDDAGITQELHTWNPSHSALMEGCHFTKQCQPTVQETHHHPDILGHVRIAHT